MENDLDMYMENLDEFIKDENKVVTYRWLSLTLKLPCDAAKRLLSHYATTHRASETLHVTYLVMGQDKTEKDIHGTKVCIVPQNRLEQVKESLWSVSCVHVYSVSKSVLPDVAGALYAADYDCVRQDLEQSTKYGGIVCSGSTQRSQEDIDSSRSKGTYLPSTPQDTRNAPDPRLSKAVKTEKTGSNEKNKDSAKSSLASMFAAQKTVKKEVTQEPSDGEKGNKATSGKATSGKAVAPAGKKQNGISGFLKNGVDPREVQPKQPVRATRSSPRKAQVKVETPLEGSPEKPVPKKSPPRKTYGRSKAKPATLPNRSRILKIDSDSSDEDTAGRASDDEEEDPIPPSPPPAQTVSDEEDPEPAPVAPAKPSRGMKRKTVDHTFEMENGYLVTKKQDVDVTDSEPEDAVPPPPKKQDVATTPVKAAAGKPSQNAKKQTQSKKSAKASPVKTKQASIMSFFSKK